MSYHILCISPQPTCSQGGPCGAFKKRQEAEGAKIVAWAWVDVGKDVVDGCKWREEDLQALKRWRQII